MSSGDLNPGDSPADQRQRRIDEIAEGFLKALHLPDGSRSWHTLVEQHPELAPDLERRLRFVQSVFDALQPSLGGDSGASRDDPTAFSLSGEDIAKSADHAIESMVTDRVVSVRCPHCGNLLRIVAHGLAEVTCGSCGSAVSIDPDATRTDSRTRAPKYVAHFKILSLLGQGAFGTAYKAQDTRLDRQVAIKIPRAGSFSTANDELRFMREARNAAQLRHPNIVQVHEIANDHGVPYLVSDFIDGITLSDLINGRRLSFRESAELMLTIAEAVQFAHDHRVIHRDLKPSNILLDNNQKPHVADFGLARQSEGEFTMTLEGEVLGTPAYMSPEQAAGKDVDVRTDIYSLGVMLYRMVCGELPFRGSQRMMLHQVLHDDPKSPRKLDERIPRDLNTIILKAMAKERDRRYPTAAAFASDLRRWLGSQPISARPVGLLGRSIRWCRRNPSGALATAAAAIALLAIVSFSIAWGYREQQQKIRETALRAVAEKSEAQSLRTLVRSHTQNGLARMQAGDLFGSLPWFAQALRLDQGDADLQRLRLAMVQQSLPTLTNMWTLGGKINSLKFSADGKSLLAASDSGAVQLCSIDEGKGLAIQSSTGPTTFAAQIDPTGTRVCAPGGDGRLNLWDVTTNRQIAKLAHEQGAWSAVFSPDGKWLATGGRDGRAAVWNASDGSSVATFEHPAKDIGSVYFSPDSTLLLTISRIDTDRPCELRLWDIVKGELKIPLMEQPKYAMHCAFSKDGKRIYAAGIDGSIWIWNTDDGTTVGEPLRQGGEIAAIFLADNDQTAIAAEHTDRIAFWDLANGQRAEHEIHAPGMISSVAVDPLQQFVAIINDGRVKVFWRYCGEILGTDIPHAGQALVVSFHPDSRRLAIGGSDGVVRIWDLAGLAPKNRVLRFTDAVTGFATSHDGQRILIGGRDDIVRQYSARAMTPLGVEWKHDGDVLDCQFDPDDRRVVTASADKTAQVWDVDTGAPIGPRMPHAREVVRATFAPGDHVITSANDGTCSIWKIGADQPLHRFNSGNQATQPVIHPDGKRFVVAGGVDSLQLRNIDDGSAIGNPIPHAGIVNTAEFSQSGNRLLTASFGGTVAVTDLTADPSETISWDVGSELFSAAIVPDGSRVLTGDGAGRLTLWVRNGKTYQPSWTKQDSAGDWHRLAVHRARPIFAAATNQSLVSGFQPNISTVRLCDLASGTYLTPPLAHYQTITKLQFTADGEHLVSSSHDGTVRLWSLTLDRLSPAEIERLANLWNGFSLDESFQRRGMDAATQQSEFDALRRKFPAVFVCDDKAIERWNDEVRWVIESQAKSP